jgi:SAM-dependent methyltransferase
VAEESVTVLSSLAEDNEVDLTIVVVNFNSADFILTSLRLVERLTVCKWRMIICDNGSGHEDFVRVRNAVSRYDNITFLARTQTQPGSTGHGEALNLLVRQIDTRYGAIMDADCLPLMYGWDRVLINQLSDTVKIAGTPVAHNTPGDPRRDRNFPLMFLCVFETQVLRDLAIDFRPRDIVAGEDTGWELRHKYSEHGYRGATLFGQNTRTYRDGPFAGSICDEYYTDETCRQLICAHFGRGSNPRSGKYRKSRLGARRAFRRDKAQWLAICDDVADTAIREAIQAGHLALDDVACPSCGSEETVKEFVAPDWLYSTPGFWTVVSCAACGLRRTNPRPKKDALAQFYPDDYAPYHAAPSECATRGGLRTRLREQVLRQHFGYFRDRLSASLPWRLLTLPLVRLFRNSLLPVLPADPERRRLLEIGCAHGERLDYLRRLGWSVHGVEFSDLASAKTRARGIACDSAFVEDCEFPAASFDAIIMSMVLEHLGDPASALARVAGWLRPGGVLLLSVPNFGGIEARLFGPYAYTLQVPTHLTHFDRATITTLLTQAGFRDIKISAQGVPRDLRGGLQAYLKDHPNVIARHLLSAPGIVFRGLGVLFGYLGISSRISISTVRADTPPEVG